MSTMTATQAAKIQDHTATLVAQMRSDADVAETAGNSEGARALRMIADSRERAGQHARAGARIGRI